MENKEKIKLIKQHLKSDFNGITNITTKTNSKGEVSFQYEFVKSIETRFEDLDKIIEDGIKSSKETIKFLQSLKEKKN